MNQFLFVRFQDLTNGSLWSPPITTNGGVLYNNGTNITADSGFTYTGGITGGGEVFIVPPNNSGGDTSILTVDATHAASSSSPVMLLVTPPTGSQKAFQTQRSGDTFSFASFEYFSGSPGIALGPGSSGRDVFLQRTGTSQFSISTGPSGGTEAMRIDSSQFVTVGGFANTAVNGTNGQVQVVSDGTIAHSFSAIAINNNAVGPVISTSKTRGTAPSSQVIVQAGDRMFNFSAYGSDGVGYQQGANLRAIVDKTPSAGSMPGAWIFQTTPSGSSTPIEAMRVDSSQNIIFSTLGIGAFGDFSGGTITPAVQIQANGPSASFGMVRFSADANPARIFFGKSRGTSGSEVAVVANDTFGSFSFQGSDGAALREGATLTAVCDGTPANNVMPTRLVFSTTPSSGLVEALRIDSHQRSNFNSSGANFGNLKANAVEIIEASGNNLGMFGNSGSTNNPNANFYNTAGANPTVQTALSSGQFIGVFGFYGSTGAAYAQGALFAALADGAYGVGSAPSRFIISTAASGSTSPAERMRIDSSGTVNIGNAGASFANFGGTTPTFQVSGNAAVTDTNMDLRCYSANSGDFFISFTKSRGSTVGSNVAVQSGDFLGTIAASGFDSTGTPVLRKSASIDFVTDAAPTAGSVAGRIMLQTTPSGSASSTEAMRIDSAQRTIFTGTGAVNTSGNVNGDDVQVVSKTGNNLGLYGYQTINNNPNLNFYFTNSNTSAITQAAVTSGQTLGSITAFGSDGTAFRARGAIQFNVDGTVSASNVPTRIAFLTGTTAATEAMRIDSSQHVNIGNGNAFANTTVGGSANILQVASATSSPNAITSICCSNDSSQTGIHQAKTRGATPSTQTIVQSGDDLATLFGWGSDGSAYRNGAVIRFTVDAAPAANSMPTRMIFATTATSSITPTERMRIDSAGLKSFTNGAFGYGLAGNGDGGTVTQATSRTTGVTLNTVCGAITLFAAAPVVGTWVTFTVTNSKVAATDVVLVSVKSGTNTYIALVSAVAAGSFNITFQSVAGTTSDSPVINFAVIKAVTT